MYKPTLVVVLLLSSITLFTAECTNVCDRIISEQLYLSSLWYFSAGLSALTAFPFLCDYASVKYHCNRKKVTWV